jgi:hypothetical protein
MKIPDYYRNYQRRTPGPPSPPDRKTPPSPPGRKPIKQPERLYRADAFSLKLYEEWEDKTIFTLSGPVTDGIQHNMTITVEHELLGERLRDYADINVKALEEELKSCRILLREDIRLANGTPAHRVIYKWYPTEDLRIYQEMILLLAENSGYKLTATFTKKTRKTLGPQVERMMLSFVPAPPAKSAESRD